MFKVDVYDPTETVETLSLYPTEKADIWRR